MKYNKIALIGMMGSGKTTIAKKLSEFYKIPFYDTDIIFENKNNISIIDFFKQYSQDEFRNEETLILKEIISKNNFILSTGGGIILSERNRAMLFSPDILTVFLSAKPSTIFERVKNDKTRPLLQVEDPKKEIEKILDSRTKYYLMATNTVITDDKTTDEIVEEIKWII